MQHQVERVLQVAQLDKEELKLNLEQLDIHELAKTSIDNLCLEHCEKEVNLVYKLDAKNASMHGDKLHLTNIFKNLVDNAAKYSGDREKPEIIIESKNISETEIQIDVIDNGIGINQRAIQHIFDKFYRVPTGNIHNVKGFGLGLYYVKTMVQAHNGEVFVASELNKGSVFSVVFPLKEHKEVLTEHEIKKLN
jgi:two-component system phosphate regulon sensor histidine kinase PhoR